MTVLIFRMLQILGRGFSMLRQFTPELCEVLYERVSNLKMGGGGRGLLIDHFNHYLSVTYPWGYKV